MVPRPSAGYHERLGALWHSPFHVLCTHHLTLLAMMAFAGNSLLCRVALTYSNFDAASFTTIRLISGAIMLWLVVHIERGTHTGWDNWLSA